MYQGQGLSGHKNGFMSDSRLSYLLINDTVCYDNSILQEEYITRIVYDEKSILREAYEIIDNYLRYNSHIYNPEILVLSTALCSL